MTNAQSFAIDGERPELTISPEKVCYLVVKAREWDGKDAPLDPDPASNPRSDV